MSLEEFHSGSESSSTDQSVNSSKTGDKEEQSTKQMFGDSTVNKEPTKEVNEKLAVDINIIKDDELVEQVAEMWTPKVKDKMEEAIQIVFNDGSTWHWPLRPWDKDAAKVRQHFIERYMPQVIRWEAMQNGEDPEEALKESMFYVDTSEPEWVDRIEDTETSEESREWFNNNADYLPDLMKTVSSSANDVDLDVDNDDWTEDW